MGVSSKVDGFFKNDTEENKEPPSKQALKDAELDRKKKHIDDEYQREKKRQEIRDKYGIQKKSESVKDKQKVLNEMKKEYGMSDEDASELQKKMFQDQEDRDRTKAKVDKKMEKRAMKKELKKDLGVDKCKQQ